MIGTISEYTVSSTNTTDELVDLIKAQEISQSPNLVPENFVLKKCGILSTSDGEVYVNGKLFTLIKNQALEFGYGLMDVKSIKSNTSGIKLIIRYLY